MASRSYGQYCALAKSLDLVGDRWTLLVVRELLDGPRRYGDLLSALSPIATDVQANNLVHKRALPRPSATTVYELTDDGRALEDVINAFARWGRHLLQTRDRKETVRPEWLVRAVRAYVRDDRTGAPVTVRLVTPEGQAAVEISEHTVESLDGEADVDVTLTGAAEVLAAAMDPGQVDSLVAAGRLTIDGDARAVKRLAKAFAPPRVRV